MNQAGANPAISVIMAVYNGAADVPKAIQSIFSQTFGDFELIIINDGSFKDDTRLVLDDIARTSGDSRLRIVHLEKNIGLAGALNHGIGLARGRYIARHDHDDISFPPRFEKQIAFMEVNPDCGLLGTASEIWVNDVPSGRCHDHPTGNPELQVFLLSNNPFVHSSIMLRHEVIATCGLYTTDPKRQPPEDYELWSRIARQYEVRNLADRLLAYREVSGSISRRPDEAYHQRVRLFSAENIAYWNGLAAPDTHCFAAAALLHGAYQDLPAGAAIGHIVDVISKAVQRITDRYPDRALSGLQKQLLKNVLRRFERAHPVPKWSKPILSAARKLSVPVKLRQRLLAKLAN